MTNSPYRRSGGCQCGAVRYELTCPLGNAEICHCRMCQKAFGSWGAALVSVALAGFRWTRGKPSEFRSSSIVSRGFCNACGTPLYMHEDGDHNIELAIGTLDNPRDVKLDGQVGVESRLPWFASMSDLPERATTDYCPPDLMEKLKSRQHPDHDTESWP